MTKSRSLLSSAKVARLGAGIHENVVISKIDLSDRKREGAITKKMFFFTFTKLDDNGKRKEEVELSWWRLDTTSEHFISNFRSFLFQVNNLLELIYTVEEIEEMFKDLFSDFETVAEFEAHKWKKPAVDAFLKEFSASLLEAFNGKIGKEMEPFRLKVALNSKGENEEIPRYGAFVESSSVPIEKSELEFSETEQSYMNMTGKKVEAVSSSSAPKL